MNNSDKPGFRKIFDSLSDYYQKEKKLTASAIQLYYYSLQDYELSQIKMGINAYLKDSENGMYFPKVADIVRMIEGDEVTADDVITLARVSRNPLGVLSRILIGSWDLDHQPVRYLVLRANECILRLPQWRNKAKLGLYTEHELSIMVKYNVSPLQPLYDGQEQPAINQDIADRFARLKNLSEKGALFPRIAKTTTGDEKNISPEIKKIISGILKKMRI